MTATANLADRSQQLAGLLLATIPLAERMLLYNLALTAWVMLPSKTALQHFTLKGALDPSAMKGN